jgi:hypothetical protein
VKHDLHLPGRVVSLVPLDPSYAEGLAALGDADAYAWHTSTLPLTTEAAAHSLEALLEIADNARSAADTAYFSIQRAEWPGVRRGLLARTEPEG